MISQTLTSSVTRLENHQVSADKLIEVWQREFGAPTKDDEIHWHISWISVGPAAVQQAVRAAFETVSGRVALAPWVAQAQTRLPNRPFKKFINHYVNPAQLGADRWACALGLAALSSIAPGETHMIVSAGTATTVDLVRVDQDLPDQAQFLGGWILPGLGLMNESLRSGTRDLDYVVDEFDAMGREIPTKSESAIAQGIGLAQTGFISGLLQLHQVKTIWLHGGHARRWHQALRILDWQSNLIQKVQPQPQLIFAGLMALAADRQQV